MATIRTLPRDAKGATIIEFALVAPVFFFVIFCIIELGLLLFSQVALESATMQVSRASSLGGTSNGCDRACTVRRLVEQKTRGLINGERVRVEARPLAQGGLPPAPDICLSDPNSIVSCAPNQPFKEVNGINGFQGTQDLNNASVGSAGDLVEIRVNYPWRLMIPFLDGIYGQDGVVMLSSSTVIKNEPF